jgi:hypothetical protein
MVGRLMMRFLAWWQWLEWAESTHDSRHTNSTHVYMRMSDQPLMDDLTVFLPAQPSPIVKEPWQYSNIHCRFGVKRTIVDAHFDRARNMIAQVGLYMYRSCAMHHVQVYMYSMMLVLPPSQPHAPTSSDASFLQILGGRNAPLVPPSAQALCKHIPDARAPSIRASFQVRLGQAARP